MEAGEERTVHRIEHAVMTTPLGPLTLVAADRALTGVYFPHHRPAPAPSALGQEIAVTEHDLLREAAEQIDEFLRGERRGFDLPTTRQGDELQERVWAELERVPFGTTTTYGEIASRLGDRALAQRVGQALATNPLSIVVPCHRVVGRDGRLTGYAGGLKRKQHLLQLEALATTGPDQLL